MKSILLLFGLTILFSCGTASNGDEREENVVRVKFTDIKGKIFDTNEKTGEYLKVKTSNGLLVLEYVQVDGSRSRFQFKGSITSRRKQGNRQIYWAKSHYSESVDKFILFGIDRNNKTIDSIYQDYGADHHFPQGRLLKLYGDLRWDGK